MPRDMLITHPLQYYPKSNSSDSLILNHKRPNRCRTTITALNNHKAENRTFTLLKPSKTRRTQYAVKRVCAEEIPKGARVQVNENTPNKHTP